MKIQARNWINESIKDYKNNGMVSAALLSSRSAFNSIWFGVTSRYPLGTNVFEFDWDLLLILDGCRVDALKEVAGEYDYLTDVSSILSVGSSSHEWIAKTFTTEKKDEIHRTALISANPFARWTCEENRYPPKDYTIPIDFSTWDVVNKEDFAYTEWCADHKHPYEDKFAAPPPRHMTDRGILAHRNEVADRMIIHYFQPHRPFIDKALETGELTDVDNYPYDAVKTGKIDKDVLWERYLDNLRLVLDDIEILLRNISAERVVISADHGELMGEIGLFGHPEGVIHPNLKRVPWVITTAEDTETYEPEDTVEKHVDKSAEERLEALGYI